MEKPGSSPSLICQPSGAFTAPDTLAATRSHLVSIGFDTNRLDARNIGGPVRAENQTEHAGYEVIEFPAVMHIAEVGASRTGGITVLLTAGPDFAPPCFLILRTAGTLAALILAALAAVQPTGRHQVRITLSCCHATLLMLRKTLSGYSILARMFL
jgi:hypothetical protein